MDQIKNNDKVMYGGNSYYAKDGGYQMKDKKGNLSKVMSKRDMANIIGLPVSSFSNKINTKENDLNVSKTDIVNFKGDSLDLNSNPITSYLNKPKEKEDE